MPTAEERLREIVGNEWVDGDDRDHVNNIITAALADARSQEAEACAQICEDFARAHDGDGGSIVDALVAEAESCADAIRYRIGRDFGWRERAPKQWEWDAHAGRWLGEDEFGGIEIYEVWDDIVTGGPWERFRPVTRDVDRAPWPEKPTGEDPVCVGCTISDSPSRCESCERPRKAT